MAIRRNMQTVKPEPALNTQTLLGIRAGSSLDLAERVESGLSFVSLERFSKKSGLPMELVRKAVRLTPRTMIRRKTLNRLSPEESDRLVTISRLFAFALDLFGGRTERANQWFTSPNRALGRRSPIDMAATEVGSREVENLIGRLEHGAFS